MAKFETLKLVEALKVNAKTGVQMTQRQEIPYGAIIENPHEVRGFLRFGYLGEMYDVKYSDIEGYYKLIGNLSGTPTAPTNVMTSPSPVRPIPVPKSDASPVSATSDAQSLRFETLKSDISIRRAKVPGGWLIVAGQGVTFVPDARHDWDGASV